jgi:endogenous inhibitor of DNA gyrase (YacG/DUF329 family)
MLMTVNMTDKDKKGLRCPKCGAQVSTEQLGRKGSPFPFCSDRCKMVDLEAWLDDEYAIEVDERSTENFE